MTAAVQRTKPRTPPRWRARLALFLAIILFIVADLAAGVTLLIRGALPQTTGTVHVAGPQGAITVTRDQFGVPHIVATDAHDLFFGQGYVTAQDRLWQMEFNRRVAAGRLSEILGNATLSADKVLRTLGLMRSAAADVDRLSPNLRTELDSYTAGVNAFISNHRDSLPLEFRVLGFTPEPWHDTDSIAYGKVVALDLDGTWNTKLARAAVLAQVGPAATAQLFPNYPADNPTLIDATGANAIPPGSEAPQPGNATASATAAMLAAIAPAQRAAYGQAPLADLVQQLGGLYHMLGNVASVAGSNDWVVSGAHTTTGMPLLANDPHLGIQYPSIWYEVALQSAAASDHYDAMGFSFPGVPGIIIGHNAHIAWGVTNGQVDDTDLYLEHMNADGSAAQVGEQMVPVEQRTEVIKVAGAPDVQLHVRVTRHGPILNDVISSLHDSAPIALQWTALQPDYTFAGFFELGAAQNWDDFQAALRDISISQNFVYADTQGNIGYRLSGWAPIRPQINGLVPVDGATTANDWTGRVPFAQMPHLFNPPTGIIWTANNQIVPPSYPYYITNDWDVGFRAKRIEQLLTAQPKLSPDDIARIQSDIVSLPAAQITPYYLQAANGDSGAGVNAAGRLFSGWDGTMARESAAAALYEVTTSRLITDLVQPLLGATVFKEWNDNEYAISKLLFAREQVQTPTLGLFGSADRRDTAIRTAENEAFTYLTTFYGTSDTSKWQWGKLHQAHFQDPLASVKPLNLIFPDASVARPGDTATVNVGGVGGFTSDNYTQDFLPSMRQIINLADLDQSRFITTTGESGEPFADHRLDLLALWDNGSYQPMDFSATAVQANAAATLTIAP